MSAKKALDRLCKIPPPRDFPWADLMTIMKANDFRAVCQKGAHYTFIHSSGLKVKASKTHPGGLLKKYQVEDVIEGLKAVGAILEEDNESGL